MTGLDKKELKSPDTFVSASDRAFAWIERHAQALGLAVGGILVLSLGWIGYGYIQAMAEQRASEALAGPSADLQKAEAKVREERAKMMADLAKEPAKSAAMTQMVRPVDFEKDYGPAVEKVKAAIRQHADTRAATVAAMNLSHFLLQNKQYAAALDVLTLSRREPGGSDILGGFWLMHKGLSLVENQRFDEAARLYESILASKAMASFHPEAILKLGIVYDAKGDSEKARHMYIRLSRDFPQSDAANSAQQYMRLLDLKPRQG